MNENKLVPIKNLIYEIRGQKVMLDSDLARLYEVEAKRLNEAVKRNIERFPDDFMFQLTKEEFTEVVANCDHLEKLKFRPTSPYVFTEQGVAMLATVLKSRKAIEVNIQIMRAFVKLRYYVLSQSGSNEQIVELKRLLMLHIDNTDYKFTEYDETINEIIDVLNNLIDKPKESRRIGFCTD